MQRENEPAVTQRERGAFVRFAAMGGLTWLAACFGAIALHVGASGSAWQDDAIPLTAKASLIGLELFLLSYPAILIALAVYVLLGRPDRPGAEKRWWRTRLVAAILAVSVPALAYAASWAVFRSTGHFLSRSTFVLWWRNPVQMAQHTAHFEPTTPALIAFGAIAFGTILVFGLGRIHGRLKGRLGWGVVAVNAVLIVSSLLLPGVIGWQAVDAFMRARRADSTGPLLRVASDLRSSAAANADSFYRASVPVAARNPIIPLEEYVAALPESAARPTTNVLVIVVESLRPDQLVSFGGVRSAMPTVDSLAQSGLRFSRHYTQASHSDYADPAILSSHFPLRSSTYHVYPESPPYPRVLLYDVLSALGYRVGIFSSQNESWGGMKHYLDTGSVDRFLHSETYDGETYVPDRDEGFAGWASGARKSGKIDDRFTVGEAIEWIGEDQKPFVIYMNLQNSHVPYVIPADFDAPFGAGEVSFPIKFGSFPKDSVEAVKDLYASSLAYVDAQIARLVEFLVESGRMDETLVVLTADTGQAFYEHDFTSHGSALYDEVMRVPLVLHGPGVEPSSRELVSQHVDIPPTVLGLLGLPPHPAFQGDDVLGLAGSGGHNVFMVGQALEEQYAVVQGQWKLIFDARKLTYELYDLAVDPGELTDLGPVRGAELSELARLLHAWRKVQLEYYTNPANFDSHYPPRVTDARD